MASFFAGQASSLTYSLAKVRTFARLYFFNLASFGSPFSGFGSSKMRK
jgi:hypothetical protein